MKFRYKEMVYRPDYYKFHTDDRTEWFPNGIYNYNVSRMISDLAEYESEPNHSGNLFDSVSKTEIQVQDAIDRIGCLDNLLDEHVEAADLNRPIIYVEVAPDSYNLIDGHHRLEKARRLNIEKLQAYCIPAGIAVLYLGSEEEYCDYVKYWNSKVKDIQKNDLAICNIPQIASPFFERNLNPEYIWKRMTEEAKTCRRVEVYSGNDEWFTLFCINKKLFCGEAEAHLTVKCAAPFAVTEDSILSAVEYFPDWYAETADRQKEQRKEIRKKIRHADLLMACIRVFSEY